MQCQTIEFLPFNIAKMVLKISPECKHHKALWRRSVVLGSQKFVCILYYSAFLSLLAEWDQPKTRQIDKGAIRDKFLCATFPPPFAYYENSSSHIHMGITFPSPGLHSFAFGMHCPIAIPSVPAVSLGRLLQFISSPPTNR